MKSLLALLALLPLTATVSAEALVKTESRHSVSVTLDRLAEIVTEKGFTVIARVDHAAAARSAGLELAPTEVLIFGNPVVGTQLMLSERSIGIDLPIRVLAWEEADGGVWVGYTAPVDLLARHGIDDRDQVGEKMTGALAAFTRAAAN